MHWNPEFTTRPEIEGSFGVVASTHWLGSAVAMGVLERGGNAFDAAVAAAFTLQVAEPHLNGPAGEAPVIVHHAASRRTEVICGQGPAPAAATLQHFQDLGLELVPGTGLLAACVPGAFDTWMRLLRDHGTLEPAELLAPAIHYARHGVPVLGRIHGAIASVRELFLTHWPTSAAVYLPGGSVPAEGTLFANPVLADTWQRILTEADTGGGTREQRIERARTLWSQGFVAEAVDRFCRTQEVMDVSGRRHRGLLTGQDMANWEAGIEAPVGLDYGHYRVFKCGPWSQGLVALQQFALLRGFDLDGLDPAGAEFVHLQVEAAKLAFADRDTFYGDPEWTRVPVDTLLGEAYNAERRRLIGREASLELRPGTIPGFGRLMDPRVRSEGQAVAAGVGEPTVGRIEDGLADRDGSVRGDTVHFDIIDRHGNMVSATPSGGWLQSSPVIPELGFCLGTRAQMFVLDPEHPATLMPGKRPRSTLSPTLALRDGEACLAWGSPGGDQQDQWSVQFLLRHVHAGYNLQQAIDAPAWHTEHFPSSFWPRTSRPGVLVVEERMPVEAVAELRARGHRVEVGGPWSEGRLSAVSRQGSRLRAAANPRGMQGYAAGR